MILHWHNWNQCNWNTPTMVIHALTPQFFTGCNFDLPLLEEQLEKVSYRWLLSKFYKMCSRFFSRGCCRLPSLASGSLYPKDVGFSTWSNWLESISKSSHPCFSNLQSSVRIPHRCPNLHLFPAPQNLLWTNLIWRPLNLSSRPLNAKSLSLHSPQAHQLSVCLSATWPPAIGLLSPTNTLLRGKRCIVGDAMSTSRRRGTDWRRWRRLWRAHRTDKRRILGLSFVFHRDHHHQMIRWC